MKMPEFVKNITDTLKSRGFEAYTVGGCVRDALMGREPYDYDVTTDATPDEIKDCFKEYKTILTGEKHGTVCVISDNNAIEVTTYRIDGEYLNLRKPESVTFTKKIEEDLARRDFTMNSIAYNGEYVDPYGGRKDIKNRLIRTVGESDKRFGEDALRIMRAIRFAATLGFEIEEETKKSIHKNKNLLNGISQERIFAELKKLLLGKYCESVLLEFGDVLGVFAPCLLPCMGFEQHNKYHIYDVYTHMVKAVSHAPYDLKIRLALLFHDVGKPECFTMDENGGHFKSHAEKSKALAKEVFDYLKLDNDTKETALSLIEHHQREIICEKKYVKRFLNKFSFELFDMLIEVMRADTLAHSSLAMRNLKELELLKQIRDEIAGENECVSLKSLKVDGNDIISMGIKDGRTIGRILNELLNDVIDGEIENERGMLLKKISEQI